MMRWARFIVIVMGVCCCCSLAAGCSEQDTPVSIDETADCENINPIHCLLPWPSSRFLAADQTTATGRRLALPASGMPVNRDGVAFDARHFDRFDGFSPAGAAMTGFDRLLDTDSLAGEDRIADSLEPGSPTVLLDAESGELVAHFAEVDQWQADRETETLYIRPAARLAEDHRYIVALRRLRFDDGTPVEPSGYFRALRDNTRTDSAALEDRRAHFEEIFASLRKAGIEREALVEAWDFHTASGQSLWGDLLHMRDDWLQWQPEGGPACTITEVTEPADDPHLYRIVKGEFRVPLYLVRAKPPSLLARDEAGRPERNGETVVGFSMVIPHSVRDRVAAGRGPGRLLVSDTGLANNTSLVTNANAHEIADRGEEVLASPDFCRDPGSALLANADANNALPFVECMTQSLLSYLVFRRALAGPCAAEEAFAIDGEPAFDATRPYDLQFVRGNLSLLSIAALTPDPARVAGLPMGMSYSTVYKHSIMGATLPLSGYEQRMARDLLLVMFQLFFDTVENATFAPHVTADLLPGSGGAQVMMITTLHRADIPNVAADMAARTAGLPLLVPSAYAAPPWNVETTRGPVESAYVVYDVNAPPIPPGAREPTGGGRPTEKIYACECAWQQLDGFFRPDGVIEATCIDCTEP